MNKAIKRAIIRELLYSPPQKSKSKKSQVPEIEISVEVEAFVDWILGGTLIPPDLDYLSFFFRGYLKEFSIKFTDFKDDYNMFSQKKQLTANDKIKNYLNKLGWKQRYTKIYMNDNMSSQALFGFSKTFEDIFIKNFGRKAYSNFLLSLQSYFVKYKL